MVWHCPCLLGTHRPGVVVAVTLEGGQAPAGSPPRVGKMPRGMEVCADEEGRTHPAGRNAGLCLRPGWEVRARPGHWVFQDG